MVREGQYILLRGQNEQYVTIGSVGGIISCDAVNRAQATKFRVLLRTTEFEDFKTYVKARVPLKRAGSVFLCNLNSVRAFFLSCRCRIELRTHNTHTHTDTCKLGHQNVGQFR